MKDYVPREALIALARPGTFETSCDGATRQEDAVPVRVIQGVPSANVVEVRHGKWVWDENGLDWGLGAWECSECHRKPETWWEADKGNPYRCAGSSYCNNCGAKMTEDHHEQKE